MFDAASPPQRPPAPRRALCSFVLSVLCACACAGHAEAARLRIVAAEAVYGDIARQIAGTDAEVVSLMANPAGDPHLYEPGPAAARAVAGADVAIANGAGYEPWFDRLLSASGAPAKVVIRVDRLPGVVQGAQSGNNPHLWVDPASGPALASALVAALAARDPAHAAGYRARGAAFEDSTRPLAARVASLRAAFAARHPPLRFAATEPVLGPLLDALGVVTADPQVALAAQNETEPGPASLARLQADLDGHRVAALVFNAQVASPLSHALRARAEADGVPTIAVAETLPAGLSWQQWLRQLLESVARAAGVA